MEFTIAVISALLSLVFLLFVKKFNFTLAQKIQDKSLPFTTKLLFAFLIGFIFFILLTPRISSILQKIIIITVSLILIYALNLKVPDLKKQESDNTTDEFSEN